MSVTPAAARGSLRRSRTDVPLRCERPGLAPVRLGLALSVLFVRLGLLLAALLVFVDFIVLPFPCTRRLAGANEIGPGRGLTVNGVDGWTNDRAGLAALAVPARPSSSVVGRAGDAASFYPGVGHPSPEQRSAHATGGREENLRPIPVRPGGDPNLWPALSNPAQGKARGSATDIRQRPTDFGRAATLRPWAAIPAVARPSHADAAR